MVMQLLGKNLENIFEEKGKFSLKTVCMIGYQFVSILEYIHNRHIIHRDIKPDNFVLGLNELSQYIYILDFGLAKKYRSSKTLEQLPFTNRGKIIGTARYASINALKGYELSRRDDLESAGYVLLYFIKGKLPWQGIITKTKDEKYKKILEKKEQISSKKLCEGLPQEFNNFIDYVRNLDYLEQPDYEMLRGLFNTMLRKDHNKFDYIYDWTTYEERLKRRVITPRSEIDSFQNKKSTLASYKNFGDSKEESSEPLRHLSLKKNNSNDLSKKDENVKNNNIYIVNTYKKNGEIKEESEEENIIISNKRGQLNSINKKEDEICCNFECNIF
jgi:serine/threonine protein kinase